MKTYIIDASVVLTGLLKNRPQVSEKAEEFICKAEQGSVCLVSPELLKIEVINGLRFSSRDQNYAKKILSLFLKFPIKYHNFENVHYKKILSMSYQNDTTIYDTLYHYLALLLDGTFLTCDKKYYSAAKELGNIQLLG